MATIVQILLNGIIAAAVYALLAMAFNLNYGATRFFHLALGGIALVGGYVMLFLLTHTAWPLWLNLILGTFAAGIACWLADLVIFKILRKSKSSTLIQVIASLGLLFVLQSALAIIFSVEYQSFPVSLATGSLEIAGGFITWTQLVMLLMAAVAFLVVWSVLKFTKYGRAIKAVSDDAEVATIVGIDTENVIGLVSFMTGCLAGLAGILTGFDTGLQPILGLTLLLKGAIGGIVGGLGSVAGGFSGAFVLGLFENVGIWFISSQWKDAIAFALLIIFLLFRPRGIFAKK